MSESDDWFDYGALVLVDPVEPLSVRDRIRLVVKSKFDHEGEGELDAGCVSLITDVETMSSLFQEMYSDRQTVGERIQQYLKKFAERRKTFLNGTISNWLIKNDKVDFFTSHVKKFLAK